MRELSAILSAARRVLGAGEPAVLCTLIHIRGSSYRPPGAMMLAWVAGRPAVSSVILGARTLEQLTDNLAAADLVLTAEENETLDTVSDPEPADYPYGRFGSFQRTRPITGGRGEVS